MEISWASKKFCCWRPPGHATISYGTLEWRRNAQRNDTNHNDIHHIDKNSKLSTTTLDTANWYSGCHWWYAMSLSLYWVSLCWMSHVIPSFVSLSAVTHSYYAKFHYSQCCDVNYCYSECCLFWESSCSMFLCWVYHFCNIMLHVVFLLLCWVLLIVLVPRLVMHRIVMLKVVMLGIVSLCVVLPNVVAPFEQIG